MSRGNEYGVRQTRQPLSRGLVSAKFSLTGAFEWFPDKVRLTSAMLLLLLLLSGFIAKPW